jgi:hypothetical protein
MVKTYAHIPSSNLPAAAGNAVRMRVRMLADVTLTDQPQRS